MGDRGAEEVARRGPGAGPSVPSGGARPRGAVYAPRKSPAVGAQPANTAPRAEPRQRRRGGRSSRASRFPPLRRRGACGAEGSVLGPPPTRGVEGALLRTPRPPRDGLRPQGGGSPRPAPRAPLDLPPPFPPPAPPVSLPASLAGGTPLPAKGPAVGRGGTRRTAGPGGSAGGLREVRRPTHPAAGYMRFFFTSTISLRIVRATASGTGA